MPRSIPLRPPRLIAAAALALLLAPAAAGCMTSAERRLLGASARTAEDLRDFVASLDPKANRRALEAYASRTEGGDPADDARALAESLNTLSRIYPEGETP
ncbi:MAG: hypothetical protein HY719_16600 [Planctomycetes bacterium]|nr:hypothetical protein [Planctomycetota bacterium]